MSSPTIRIRVTGIEEVSVAMRAAIDEGVLNAVEAAGMRAVQIIVPITPVDFGNLANAIQWKLESVAPTIRGMVFAGPPADVYAAPVETGTRPHFPPIAALLPWVKHKLGILDEKQAVSVAFAIARSIARRGTKGAYMFQKAFEQLNGEVVGIFETELAKSIQKHGLAPTGGAA